MTFWTTLDVTDFILLWVINEYNNSHDRTVISPYLFRPNTKEGLVWNFFVDHQIPVTQASPINSNGTFERRLKKLRLAGMLDHLSLTDKGKRFIDSLPQNVQKWQDKTTEEIDRDLSNE